MPSKAGKSGSDMTIGDFWGIEKVVPQFDDDKGISLLIINNSRFIPLLSEVQFHFECLNFRLMLFLNITSLFCIL